MPAIIALTFTEKENYKEVLIKVFKNGVLVFSSMVFSYLVVVLSRTYLDVVDFKSVAITINLKQMTSYFKSLFLQFEEGIPNLMIFLTNYYILVLTLCINYGKNNHIIKKRLILSEILIYIISFLEVWGTISLLSFYISDRIQIAYIVCCMFNLFMLLSNSKLLENTNYRKAFYIILSILILFNIGNSHNMTLNYHIALNKTSQYVTLITDKIVEYEKASNNSITKIKWCYDSEMDYNDINVRKLGEVSAKRIGNWCASYAMEYYFGQKYNLEQDDYLIEKKFKNMNWNEANDEQFIFEDNTLFLCIY